MAFRSWLGSLLSSSRASGGRVQPSARPSVEQLEDRCVLTGGVLSPAVLATPPFFLANALALDFAPKGNPQVVFLGDSISAWYANSPAWSSGIAPLGASDLAVSGNRTENVLWQLETGLLNGTAPKVIVLMIGTNNLGVGQTPQDTAQGVAACVTALRLREPQAQILLLGILPAESAVNLALRQEITETNALIAGLNDGVSVHFLDVGASFLKPDGTLLPGVLLDGLHPTAAGYQLLTDAIAQPLQSMLSETRIVSATSLPYGSLRTTTSPDGTFTQFEAAGPVPPGGILYVSVAAKQHGQVIDVLLSDGSLFQADADGARLLAQLF